LSKHKIDKKHHSFTFLRKLRKKAKPAIAEKAFQRDYEGIKNDVKRQSVEMQSYDDNNRYGATLPLFDYNFNHVAADARMTGEYDDSYDDDEDLEDLD